MELKTWHFVTALILFTGLNYLLGNWDLKKRSPDTTTRYLTELDDEVSITNSLSSDLCFVLFYTENSAVCDRWQTILIASQKTNIMKQAFSGSIWTTIPGIAKRIWFPELPPY